MKEKMVTDIGNRMGKDLMTYDSIRQHTIRDTRAKNLIGTSSQPAPFGDGMVAAGDGRLLAGGLKLVMRTKRIITSSCHSNWQCINCGTHGRRPAFKTRGEAGPPGVNQAVFLGDQNIPAILPANGDELCIKILRIENGGLLELADEFLTTLGNRRFSPGSVILLFSFSHLCNVGLTAYIEDYLAAEKLLIEKLGRETRVAPLPPMLLTGCDNKHGLRLLSEFMGWTADYFYFDECFLEESHKTAASIIQESGSGSWSDWEERRYRLPDKNSDSKTKLWCSTLDTNEGSPPRSGRSQAATSFY
jgi:hypothetical protein